LQLSHLILFMKL